MYQILVDNELFCDSRVDDLAVIEPVVTLEANSAGTFTCTIPPDHPYIHLIKNRTSNIKVLRDNMEIFEGFCVWELTDFFNQKMIECEGSLSYLNDSILRPAHYHDMTTRQLLETYISQHNAQTEDYKHFRVGIVTARDSNDSITCNTNYESTLESIKKDLVDDYGGYIRVRNENGIRYIDYLEDSVNTNTQSVKLGVNMLDYESNIDSSELANAIIPLGAVIDTETDERVSIRSVNNGSDFIQNDVAVNMLGKIEKCVIFDTIETPSALLSKARKYLNETQFENLIITAKVIDLHYDNKEIEQFKILDKIRVVSSVHGLDRYFVLTHQTINLNDPEQDTFVLGKVEQLTLSAKTAAQSDEINKKIDNLPSYSSILEAAKNNATELIKLGQNGYISFTTDSDGRPTELLIMDTNSKETATKVWRFNASGLAYSNNGYDGQYGLAITMDGSIVADYVTTGTMAADRIKGGSLVLGGANNENGQFYLKDSYGNVLITMNKDGLSLSDNVRISANNIYGGRLILGGNGAYADIQVLDENGNQTGIWTKDGLFSIKGKIAGWNLTVDALWKGSDQLAHPNGKYLGVNGFSISDYFVVDNHGLWQKNPDFKPKQFQKLITQYAKDIQFTYSSTGYVRIYYINVPENTYSSFRVVVGSRLRTDKAAAIYVSRQFTKTFYTSILHPDYDSPDGNRLYYDSTLQTNVQCTDINLDSLKLKGNGSLYDKDIGQMTYDPNTDIFGWYLNSIEYNGTGEPLQIYKIEIVIDGKTTTYDGKMVCREKGTLFSTRTGEFTTENVMVTNDGIDVYDNAKIVGYLTKDEGTENYNIEKKYEITERGLMHKDVYYTQSYTGKAVYIDANGYFYSSSSSQRYKDDISYNTAMFDCHALYKLPVAVFRYKEECGGGDMMLGLIAEDVANIFPVAAVNNNDGIVETWDERVMIPALLKLIQEQNARIERLERVIENGKNQ